MNEDSDYEDSDHENSGYGRDLKPREPVLPKEPWKPGPFFWPKMAFGGVPAFWLMFALACDILAMTNRVVPFRTFTVTFIIFSVIASAAAILGAIFSALDTWRLRGRSR